MIVQQSSTVIATLAAALALGGCAGGAIVAAGLAVPSAASSAISAMDQGPPQAATSEAALYGNYLAGLHARAQNDNAGAAGYMSRVLAGDPLNAAVLREAFLMKLQDGAMADAIALAKQLLLAEPGNQIAGLSVIAEAFRAGDYAGAKSLIGKLDQRGLGALLAPLLDAWAQHGLGNNEQALAALAPLSQQKAFAVFQSYNSAMIAALGQRDESAEKWFNQTLNTQGGGSIRVVQAYGQFLESRGKHQQAAKIYGDILERAGQHPLLSAALARAQAARGAPLLAATTTDGVAEALFGIGSVLGQDAGAGQLPLVYLRLAIYLKPGFPVAQTLLANLLENMQRWNEAIAAYAAIPSASPLYQGARIQMALNENRAGRGDAAIASLRQLSAALPGAQEVTVALADLLRSLDQFEEAATVYDKAIAQIGAPQPRHWILFYARGVCLERTGKWQQAEADLQRALQLQPDQPLALNYLAYSWIEHGVNLVEARKMIENAARQRPDDGFIIDSLGWALYRSGDYTGSVSVLENAITLRPQDAVINDHLGDAYWRVGRKMEARFQWRRALIFKPEAALVRSIEKKLETGLGVEAIEPKLVDSGARKS